jgi:hypothetical protein
MDPVAAQLSRLSAREMVTALRADRLPSVVARQLERGFRSASGLARAAQCALADLAVSSTVLGSVPATGPVLLVSNHPGAYDALCLLAAAGRDDVCIIAADRAFLRGLPGLAPHLLFVDEHGDAVHNFRALVAARGHLARGGALLHFGAGKIELDPDFAPADQTLLLPWHPGAAVLARLAMSAGGTVHPALVRGVHSTRAKRLPPVQLAEHFGVTTLAPLLQVAYRMFRDVAPRVRFGAAIARRELMPRDPRAVAAHIRQQALELAQWP